MKAQLEGLRHDVPEDVAPEHLIRIGQLVEFGLCGLQDLSAELSGGLDDLLLGFSRRKLDHDPTALHSPTEKSVILK